MLFYFLNKSNIALYSILKESTLLFKQAIKIMPFILLNEKNTKQTTNNSR